MQKKILVTGASLVPEGVMDYLRKEGFQVIYHPKDNWTAEELHQALKGMNGYIIGGYEEPTAEHFERSTDLEVVAWPGTDFKAYVPGWKRGQDLGIAFVKVPGANVNAVAELTIALMLVLMRKIGQRIETKKETEPFAGSGTEMLGKTLGIIGMGQIGSKVAQLAKIGFGMNVVYTSRSRHQDLEKTLGVKWVSKSELLSSADVVSIHRPGLAEGESPELGKSEFAKMKKGAILINTVKWNIVDTDVLFDALNKGNILAAAFDGIGEGPSWEKLKSLGADKFVWFPQTGFNTDDANYRASSTAAKAAVEVLRGGSSPYVDNPDFKNKRKRK